GKGLSPGLLSVRDTTSLGRERPGTGFNSVELIQLKIVVFAPIPNARVRIAIPVKPGLFRSTRNPNLQSCSRFDICLSLRQTVGSPRTDAFKSRMLSRAAVEYILS